MVLRERGIVDLQLFETVNVAWVSIHTADRQARNVCEGSRSVIPGKWPAAIEDGFFPNVLSGPGAGAWRRPVRCELVDRQTPIRRKRVVNFLIKVYVSGISIGFLGSNIIARVR